MLTIYNSLTRRKEKFQPIDPGKVRMYVCGITVYDYCHIGHARMILVFDMIVRYLRFRGYEVNYVRNITDIDDKIINRSLENGEPFSELTRRFIQAMNKDFEALNVLVPDSEPRATDHIEQIVVMISRLLDNGYAYRAENGDIFYDVSAFEDYGKLSGKNIEELRAGIRVDVQEEKADPVDFVLWKAEKPGEPAWDSPWGRGRPGWHIECSAMSTHCLGDDFDIHGGGQDLRFPHHENEIAQSRGAGSRTFVNMWIHNGFVRVDDEKMSKSLDNYVGLAEPAETMYGKILSIPDTLIYRYFELASDEETDALPELHKLCIENPRDAKHRLALSITRFYHGIEAAEKAREHFERTVIRKEVPKKVASFKPEGDGQIGLLNLLTSSGLTPSNGAARRLVQQGAVSIDGQRVTDSRLVLDVTKRAPFLVRVGKRRFVRIVW